MKTGIISTKRITSMSLRIDPSLHLSDGIQVHDILRLSPYGLLSVKDVSDKVFLGNIFSRVFVKDKVHGKTYLSASDTVLANIETGRYLSRKQAEELNYLCLKKDWILVTCSGTLGNVIYTNKTFEDKIATHDLIRIVPNDNQIKKGVVYAFLSSKYGYYQITQSQFGGVVKHINDKQTENILIPLFPQSFQIQVDALIQESAKLREEASDYLDRAQSLLKRKANLPILTPDYYDYYGPAGSSRKVSTFIRKRKEIDTTTLNAFNHSERVRSLEQMISCKCCLLEDVLIDGEFFSTGSFPRVEVKEKHGIMLINQSDIFDNIIKGKYISKRGVKTNNLVEYGEVLIAGVGTLGENETFCRTIFANEDLEGQLVSGEFLRMKTNGKVPSGYLYAWLSSDYGFRLIRSTQTGTKLCRPIQKLLLKKKIPIIDSESMNEIDELVREAHTKRHKANQMELKAISMVEQEIEKWSN